MNSVNYLSPASFKLVVPRTDTLEFNCVGVTLPNLSIGEVSYNTPQRNISVYADKLNFDTLSVRMIVDENMLNYREVFDWMNELVYTEDREVMDKVEDLTLIVMSSHNNPVQKISFTSCYPTSLGGMEFNSSVTSIDYITAEVEFKFVGMKFL